MAVSIAENVLENLEGYELDKVNEFKQSPGYGGQRVVVETNHTELTINHVTSGKGPGHVTIFYERQGNDYNIIGVGRHDGEKKGKTKYRSLWNGRQNRRVEVVIKRTF